MKQSYSMRWLNRIRAPLKENPKRKKYKLVDGCPNCGDSDSENQIRLRVSFNCCRKCGAEYDADESF